MAKTYKFIIMVQQAEHNADGTTAIIYGGASSTYDRIPVECTFAEALLTLPEISANEPRSHVVYLGMASSRDRKPPGWNNADKVVYGGLGSQTRQS
jgi:hypothetical protein